jgi:hypothetical protein
MEFRINNFFVSLKWILDLILQNKMENYYLHGIINLKYNQL